MLSSYGLESDVSQADRKRSRSRLSLLAGLLLCAMASLVVVMRRNRNGAGAVADDTALYQSADDFTEQTLADGRVYQISSVEKSFIDLNHMTMSENAANCIGLPFAGFGSFADFSSVIKQLGLADMNVFFGLMYSVVDWNVTPYVYGYKWSNYRSTWPAPDMSEWPAVTIPDFYEVTDTSAYSIMATVDATGTVIALTAVKPDFKDYTASYPYPTTSYQWGYALCGGLEPLNPDMFYDFSKYGKEFHYSPGSDYYTRTFAEANAFCTEHYDGMTKLSLAEMNALMIDPATGKSWPFYVDQDYSYSWLGVKREMANGLSLTYADGSAISDVDSWSAKMYWGSQYGCSATACDMYGASYWLQDKDVLTGNIYGFDAEDVRPFICEGPRKAPAVTFVAEEPMSWSDASAYCTNTYGTGLAQINDAETNALYASFTSGDRMESWIGLRRTAEQGFVWSDASTPTYTNWAKNQPDNNSVNRQGSEYCAVLYGADGLWNDEPCNTKLPFFCQ